MDSYELQDNYINICDNLDVASVLNLCRVSRVINTMTNRYIYSPYISYRELWGQKWDKLGSPVRYRRYLSAILTNKPLIEYLATHSIELLDLDSWNLLVDNHRELAWIIKSTVNIRVPTVQSLSPDNEFVADALNYIEVINLQNLRQFGVGLYGLYQIRRTISTIVFGQALTFVPSERLLRKYPLLASSEIVVEGVVNRKPSGDESDGYYKDLICKNQHMLSMWFSVNNLPRTLKYHVSINQDYSRYMYAKFPTDAYMSGYRFKVSYTKYIRNVPDAKFMYERVFQDRDESDMDKLIFIGYIYCIFPIHLNQILGVYGPILCFGKFCDKLRVVDSTHSQRKCINEILNWMI